MINIFKLTAKIPIRLFWRQKPSQSLATIYKFVMYSSSIHWLYWLLIGIYLINSTFNHSAHLCDIYWTKLKKVLLWQKYTWKIFYWKYFWVSNELIQLNTSLSSFSDCFIYRPMFNACLTIWRPSKFQFVGPRINLY